MSAALRSLASAVALAALAGCATYQARPLATAPDLGAGAQALKIDVARLRLAPLRPVTIDPRRGFDPLQIAVLAVLNSPDLAARRAALGVSSAQVFAAGLLPDPQVSAGFDNPISGPDTHQAYSASVTLDIAGLIAHANTVRAARFAARQADLDLLWAEWTTAQQARTLAETALANEAKAAALGQIASAARNRADRSGAALARHDLSLPAHAADLAAAVDAETAAAVAGRDAGKARRDLNAMLGLDASVRLPLVEGPPPVGYDDADVNRALADLARRRPDLLALQAAYQAQDANLRRAILAQFPLNSLVWNFARDTSANVTSGLAAGFAAMIFNGGRGDARVQNATREQLHAEYQARLDLTDAEVKDALAERGSAEAQAAILRASAPAIEAQLAPGRDAFARGDLDSQSYLSLMQSALGRRADLADRDLASRTAEIRLETALFLPPASFRAVP